VRNRASLWTWRGNLDHELKSRGYKVQRVAFTPDGSRIITIADNPSGRSSGGDFAELWDRAGRRLAGLDAPGFSTTNTLRFDPRSRYFCVQGFSRLRVFDRDGELVGTLAAANGINLSGAAVSPDGARVVALFSDGKARVWNFDTRRRAMTLEVGPATHIAFSKDGRLLMAAMPSGTIQRHALDIEDLFGPAAQRVDRTLTGEEADRFGVAFPPRFDPQSLRRAADEPA
jgi:WD40 repeat protein